MNPLSIYRLYRTYRCWLYGFPSIAFVLSSFLCPLCCFSIHFPSKPPFCPSPYSRRVNLREKKVLLYTSCGIVGVGVVVSCKSVCHFSDDISFRSINPIPESTRQCFDFTSIPLYLYIFIHLIFVFFFFPLFLWHRWCGFDALPINSPCSPWAI